MKVCKCDRCGKIFEPLFNKDENDFFVPVIQLGTETFSYKDVVGEVEYSYDICEDCSKEFLKWFKNGQEIIEK